MKAVIMTDELRELASDIRKLSRRINYEIRMNDGCTDEHIKGLQAEYVAKRDEFNRTAEYV